MVIRLEVTDFRDTRTGIRVRKKPKGWCAVSHKHVRPLLYRLKEQMSAISEKHGKDLVEMETYTNIDHPIL